MNQLQDNFQNFIMYNYQKNKKEEEKPKFSKQQWINQNKRQLYQFFILIEISCFLYSVTDLFQLSLRFMQSTISVVPGMLWTPLTIPSVKAKQIKTPIMHHASVHAETCLLSVTLYFCLSLSPICLRLSLSVTL